MRPIFALIAVTLTACVSGGELTPHYKTCLAKYDVPLPPGATPPTPQAPIRIAARADPRSAYACVLVTVDETGTVSGGRVLETDSSSFGEYLLDLVAHTKFRPAMIDGKPFGHSVIIEAQYE